MAASQTKPVYGLLGRKLGHSYSPRIHAMLGDYEYRLHEVEPDDVAAFIREGDFCGAERDDAVQRDRDGFVRQAYRCC